MIYYLFENNFINGLIGLPDSDTKFRVTGMDPSADPDPQEIFTDPKH
jgi:hypothetical protein